MEYPYIPLRQGAGRLPVFAPSVLRRDKLSNIYKEGLPRHSAAGAKAGGKSGLHEAKVAGNARREQSQGKCNREQTARLRSSRCYAAASLRACCVEARKGVDE